MTKVVVEHASPSDSIIDDAKRIHDKTRTDSVTVEDAVDNQWFIRVEGSVDSLSESEFYDFCQVVEDCIESDHEVFKQFYGVGSTDGKYLIRVEF